MVAIGQIERKMQGYFKYLCNIIYVPTLFTLPICKGRRCHIFHFFCSIIMRFTAALHLRNFLQEWCHGYHPNTYTQASSPSYNCSASRLSFFLLYSSSPVRLTEPCRHRVGLGVVQTAEMKIGGSSSLFCLRHLWQGNKCTTVRWLGSMSTGVTAWRPVSPFAVTLPFLPSASHHCGQPDSRPSCTTACPFTHSISQGQPQSTSDDAHLCVWAGRYAAKSLHPPLPLNQMNKTVRLLLPQQTQTWGQPNLYARKQNWKKEIAANSGRQRLCQI